MRVGSGVREKQQREARHPARGAARRPEAHLHVLQAKVADGDDLTADQFTKVLYWINQQEGVLETISDSFRGSLVTGMNLLQVWLIIDQTPFQEI